MENKGRESYEILLAVCKADHLQLRQTFVHCGRFPTAASRNWLQTDARLAGKALPPTYAQR